MDRQRTSRAGAARALTLFEVLLAILLLGLLMMYVIPSLTGTIDAAAMPESAERLRSLIHLTRAAAMRDGVRYRLAFPGAPNPDDPRAERLVEAAAETQQPVVEREADPINRPGVFEGADLFFDIGHVLLPGIRCVAVYRKDRAFDRGDYYVNNKSPFAGPEVNIREAPMDVITFNPDGTSDWAMFMLTSLPYDQEAREDDIGRILTVILDGRTGQTWFQRKWRNTEIELMDEYGASPVLHVDFTRPDEITEQNILQIHLEVQRAAANQ